MNPKLIIGRKSFSDSEIFISGDDSPENIDQRLFDLFGVNLDEEDSRRTDYLEFPNQTITTFSPYVISWFVHRCNTGEDAHPLENVFFHCDGEDYRVLDFVEKARLVHFDLGELYTDLELQFKLTQYLSTQ